MDIESGKRKHILPSIEMNAARLCNRMERLMRGSVQKELNPTLPLTPSIYSTKCWKVGQNDPDSLYNCYKRFLKVRKEFPALTLDR